MKVMTVQFAAQLKLHAHRRGCNTIIQTRNQTFGCEIIDCGDKNRHHPTVTEVIACMRGLFYHFQWGKNILSLILSLRTKHYIHMNQHFQTWMIQLNQDKLFNVVFGQF